MTKTNSDLFDAFRDDHATLGAAVHQLRMCVMEGDAREVSDSASRLNQIAGAHIAFEENDFYPALEDALSNQEVSDLYFEHAMSRQLVHELMSMRDNVLNSAEGKQNILNRIDVLETHLSECGELFGVMGGLDEDTLKHLLKQLLFWREQAPTWANVPLVLRELETSSDE